MNYLHHFNTIVFAFLLLIASPCISISQTEANNPTQYVIIITGTELLNGLYADSHTQFLTRTLNPLGCQCVASMFVGDQPKDLRDALEYASQHAELIIVTGGLGPTEDDITREVLSDYTGVKLNQKQELVEYLQKRFHQNQLQTNRKRLTLTPATGTYMPNPNGTAAGLIFEASDHVIVAMPGPPRELRPMVQNHLLPYLESKFGIKTIGASITMRFVGIGESSIDRIMDEHLTFPDDIIISSLFEYGRVDLTFGVPGNSDQDRKKLKQLEKDLLKHIGEYMYTDEGLTLEQVVLNELQKRQATLSTAEVGSGGALAASFIFSANPNGVFQGSTIAPSNNALLEKLSIINESSENLNGDEWAKRIVQKITSGNPYHWGVVVSEKFEEQDTHYVWLGFGSDQVGYEAQKISLRGSGESMRDRLVTSILDRLRRKLTIQDPSH